MVRCKAEWGVTMGNKEYEYYEDMKSFRFTLFGKEGKSKSGANILFFCRNHQASIVLDDVIRGLELFFWQKSSGHH